MNPHFTYLYLDIASVLFPFLLSFDKKVAFYKTWKYLLPAILLSAILFIVWDEIFTLKNVWSFNPDYITGVYIFHLPIEEILFFICVPYSCLFIHEVIKAYIANEVFSSFTSKISSFILILCLILCFVFYNKTYTIVNAGFCFILVFLLQKTVQKKFLGKFYLAFLISLVPFLICNGLLTSLPIVLYNNEENMDIRIFTIPCEDVLYCLSLLITPTLFIELFKLKTNK